MKFLPLRLVEQYRLNKRTFVVLKIQNDIIYLPFPVELSCRHRARRQRPLHSLRPYQRRRRLILTGPQPQLSFFPRYPTPFPSFPFFYLLACFSPFLRPFWPQQRRSHSGYPESDREKSTPAMTIQFGSFEGICETAALVICPLVESDQGVEPTCYSRNVDLGGTLIFQPCECCDTEAHFLRLTSLSATCFIHIVAIIMTAIMIYHIRSKYTAVGG